MLINGLFALVIAGFSWWAKTMWAMISSQQQQITELNIELAKNYVPRAELQDTFKQIFQKLDDIQKEIKGGRD